MKSKYVCICTQKYWYDNKGNCYMSEFPCKLFLGIQNRQTINKVISALLIVRRSLTGRFIWVDNLGV